MSARDRLHLTAVRDNDRAVKELIARVHDRTPRPPRGGRRFAPQTEPPPWVVAPRRPVAPPPAAAPEPAEPSHEHDVELLAAQLVAELEQSLRRAGVEADLVAQVTARLRAPVEDRIARTEPAWRRVVAAAVITSLLAQIGVTP